LLNRIRRLNISLAAKCQLLFGAALVLIIAAALFVPWQRMEQLTDQLNDTAAGAIAETIVRQHVLYASPPTTAASPTTGAATQPSTQPSIRPARAGAGEYMPAHLIALHPKSMESLTPWERSVLAELQREELPRTFTRTYYRRDGSAGFRYAQTVVLGQECIRCHVSTTGAPSVDPTMPWAATPIHSHRTKPASNPATNPSQSPAFTASVSPAMPGTQRVLGFVSVDIPSQIRLNQQLLNRVFMLTAGMLAGTLAIVVFYVIVTSLILQPVRVLQETAEKVSSGDLNIRSDIHTGDEFQQLSETFNTMLINLNRNAEQLRSINKNLDIKVGQLAESNVALYESNRLKSEFLANVSHELRTPLNSILGFAELLKDVTATDNKSSRYVQNIQQSGKNLLDLINDLLDLAKIEAGRMEVRAEPLSLNDLFEGLASILKPVTAAKSLILSTSVAPETPILHTDPPKLQQVLYNFLANAIKFSPADGAIYLKAEVEPDSCIRISVTDQGPGIDPEKQQIIFEKFRQIDGSVTRAHSGTGLGLAISKELTTLLEGTIGVDSAPNRGASFWIRLPQKIQSSVKDVRGRMVIT
jgi:signal transduction histidine kinase